MSGRRTERARAIEACIELSRSGSLEVRFRGQIKTGEVRWRLLPGDSGGWWTACESYLQCAGLVAPALREAGFVPISPRRRAILRSAWSHPRLTLEAGRRLAGQWVPAAVLAGL